MAITFWGRERRHSRVEQAIALVPDVVLMDVRMPGMDGVEAVGVLRERVPACRVIMLTTFDDQQFVVQALKAGTIGYLLKDLPSKELAASIRLAQAGVAQFDSGVAARLADPVPALTTRETDVLRLVARGLSNREIAQELFLSEGTVKTIFPVSWKALACAIGLRPRSTPEIAAWSEIVT